MADMGKSVIDSSSATTAPVTGLAPSGSADAPTGHASAPYESTAHGNGTSASAVHTGPAVVSSSAGNIQSASNVTSSDSAGGGAVPNLRSGDNNSGDPTAASADVGPAETAQPESAAATPSAEAADSADAEYDDASEGEPEDEGDGDEEDEEGLSPARRQKMVAAAEQLKAAGNQLYVAKEYQAAAIKYNEAIDAAPPRAPEVAVYMANLAACHVGLKQYSQAADCCTAALDVNPTYVKALMRRGDAYEQLDNLEQALVDAKVVLEMDAANTWAVKTVARLQPLIQAKNEKMKDEMLGKLKDLGNSLLGKFGMSLDNFKAEKDPATGSYNIKFGK